MKKVFAGFFLSFLVCFSFTSWAQTKTVTGKVMDDAGVGIPNVSMVVKGTANGSSTGSNGDFSLSVPASATTLVFTSVGYQIKEVGITNTFISVVLKKLEGNLEEVVVVGYGTQKKSVVTGAISSVKSKDLERVPNGRLEQALQGRVSGVTIASNSGQPGSSSTIRVRGITTLGGGNDPLYVIDNVVVDAGAIAYLNQSDIESIEVLKDAASAAIYGTRAATGVILVTTKKGKAGKSVFAYNGFYGISAPAKMLSLLNATQYAALANEKSVNGGGNVLFPDLSIYGKGTDWQKQIFNNSAKRYNHELSLSGGSDKFTYYLSFVLQDQEGIVASDISNYSKKGFRINTTYKINSIFTFGQTLGFTHQKSMGLGNTNSEFGGPLSSAINLDPITPVVITDPSIAAQAPYSSNPVLRDALGNPYGISSLVGQEMVNPVAYIKTRLGNHAWSNDLIGNAYLEAVPITGLKLRSSIGGKMAYWGNQNFNPVFYLSPTVSLLKNNYGKGNNNTLNWNLENTISYNRKIQNHDVTLLVGQGAYVSDNGGGSGVTLYNLPITSYRDASFNFDIPQTDRESGAYEFTNHKLSSLFARLNYNYKEKYLFTGIVRRDGSSRFGSNYKYGNFPSFSLGWNVYKEDFWQQNDVINMLKLRGGYGIVGNDNIGNFRYVSTVVGGFNYTYGNSGVITTGYAPSTLNNPDLRWEETSQTNVGFEAQLFKSVNISADYFKKVTSDILRDIPIPGYVGVSSSPAANIADMQNEGVELELSYTKNFNDLVLGLSGNVAYLKNKVTYLNSDANFINGDASFQSMGPVTRTQVGQSYNAFFGYKTDGIFQNWNDVTGYADKTSGALIQPNAMPGDFKWQDLNGDGKITEADRTFLGTNIPKYTYGFTLTANYKNFDVLLFTQGAAGSKIFQGLRRLDIGTANYSTKALSRWTGEGTSNNYPRLTTNDANENFSKMSDFYLEKGDYLRLKIAQLGYTVKYRGLEKAGISRLRFYVTGENLFTFTDYTGYDPEVGGGVYGIDKGQYPQARSIIGGVQLQF